jgi:hypothetical protein
MIYTFHPATVITNPHLLFVFGCEREFLVLLEICAGNNGYQLVLLIHNR